MGLCFDNDLVPGVDRSNTGKALNDTLAGRHLGAVRVRTIALPDAALAALAILGMLSQPLAQLGGFLLH